MGLHDFIKKTHKLQNELHNWPMCWYWTLQYSMCVEDKQCRCMSRWAYTVGLKYVFLESLEFFEVGASWRPEVLSGCPSVFLMYCVIFGLWSLSPPLLILPSHVMEVDMCSWFLTLRSTQTFTEASGGQNCKHGCMCRNSMQFHLITCRSMSKRLASTDTICSRIETAHW